MHCLYLFLHFRLSCEHCTLSVYGFLKQFVRWKFFFLPDLFPPFISSFTLSLGHWLSQLCRPVSMAGNSAYVMSCLHGPILQVMMFLTFSFRERKLQFVSNRWCLAQIQKSRDIFQRIGVMLDAKLIRAWKTLGLILLEAGFELRSQL